VGVVATSDLSDPGPAEGAVEMEIDPRQLARERADAQRIRQGTALLVVIGLLVIVWTAASRFSAAR
jgi:hypothetical protein